jgi:hypothetical protein
MNLAAGTARASRIEKTKTKLVPAFHAALTPKCEGRRLYDD